MNPNSISVESALSALENGHSLAEHAGFSRATLKALYATATGHFEAGRAEDALKALFQLVALEPRKEDHWALLGNTFALSGQFKAAVGAWQMAMTVEPRYATAAMIARTAIALKDKESAAEALLMAGKLKLTEAHQSEFDALIEAWYALA